MQENFIDLRFLPDVLLPWFAENKRDLPWRKDRQPYHVWLSEIMLQQTRVEAVKGYYSRFLEKYPTIDALSQADEQQLAKLWEGLGYYSRMRNLKKAADEICRRYAGVFPREYDQIRSLSGIGDYTAGAICSIAFNEKIPAVDGNVLRVFSRLTDDTTPIDLPAMKKKAAEQLQAIYPDDAGAFTQALMELGATICGPNRKPDCLQCPCREHCLGYQRNTAQSLPVKTPKKQRREEDLTVFILSHADHYALEKRPNRGLLAGLWQFPNVSGKLSPQQAVEYLLEGGFPVREILQQSEKKHIFTHIQWNMRGFYVRLAEMSGECEWKSIRQIEQEVSLPTAFRQFWIERPEQEMDSD